MIGDPVVIIDDRKREQVFEVLDEHGKALSDEV